MYLIEAVACKNTVSRCVASKGPDLGVNASSGREPLFFNSSPWTLISSSVERSLLLKHDQVHKVQAWKMVRIH